MSKLKMNDASREEASFPVPSSQAASVNLHQQWAMAAQRAAAYLRALGLSDVQIEKQVKRALTSAALKGSWASGNDIVARVFAEILEQQPHDDLVRTVMDDKSARTSAYYDYDRSDVTLSSVALPEIKKRTAMVPKQYQWRPFAKLKALFAKQQVSC